MYQITKDIVGRIKIDMDWGWGGGGGGDSVFKNERGSQLYSV